MFAGLSVFLLSTLSALAPERQEQKETLPPVGSDAAIESQEAFREWQAKVLGELQPHYELEYQYQLALSFQEDVDQVTRKASMNGGGHMAARSLREYQHQTYLAMDPKSQTPLQFQADIHLDGTQAVAVLKSPAIPGIEDGFRMEIDQKKLEKAYRDYLPLLSGLSSIAMQEEDIPPEMAPMMDKLFEMYSHVPPDMAHYFHPTGYWGMGLRYFTCRDFQVRGDIVEATLTLDVQEGSFLYEVGETTVQALIDAGEIAESDLAAMATFLPFFHSLVDDARLVMRFDEKTGIPIGLTMDFYFNVRDLDLDIQPTVHLTANYRGILRMPSSPDGIEFRALPEAAETMDVTGFLDMGLIYLRNLVAEQEMEEDVAF